MINMNTEICCNYCKNIIKKPKSYFNKQKQLGFKSFYCSNGGKPSHNLCCSRKCSGKYRAKINHKNL